ncbi:hypothetical protein [Paenibacillus sp. GCM10012306]|uniref:hypothetical protein n=1 Tax=Paenibacillus sp. GCM10012306 TaxID=3317342 RepID=UPI00361C84AC
MKGKVKIISIIEVLFVVVIHVLTISFLYAGLEKWGGGEAGLCFLVYSILTILTYISCKMSLKAGKFVPNILWFVFSVSPSLKYLNYLKGLHGQKSNVAGLIDLNYLSIKPPYTLIDLLISFPFFYLTTQLFLIFMLWLMQPDKEEKR